jgi:hypothetical protein
MQDLERVEHTVGKLIPVAMLSDDEVKGVFLFFISGDRLWRLISQD